MELGPPLNPSFTDSDDTSSATTATAASSSSAPSSPKGGICIVSRGTVHVSALSRCGSEMDEGDETASPSANGHNQNDPYADVRQRMEALASQDRARHLHQHRRDHATSKEPRGTTVNPHSDITIFAALTTYLGYIVLIMTGHIRDICAKFFRKRPSDDLQKYAPLLKSWENFYTRRLYHRIQDCFNRPIASRPAAVIDVLERISFDGRKHYGETTDGKAIRKCLNLGSYNYLGFADDWDITCQSAVLQTLVSLPSSMASSRCEYGTSTLHSQVESIVASFVGKEDAIVLNMGFNTNATIIPTLTSRGDLIVSDELNHTSIVNGARASGAAIRTFRHNDDGDLEGILREAIVIGQPRTRRPWNRILVVVEGIYSMEGEYCNLRRVVDVCKRYGAYVYLDEAHSIGAMGASGRGCCEYAGVDPRDVDVLMGTFTKSFGGMGGYVAADKRIIDMLRRECAGSSYHNSLSPVVCQQIISSFKVIMGQDGTNIGQEKLTALRDNSNYFRMRLTDMGLHVLGNYDSPIMPVMLYNPTKIAAFSRECLKRGLAVVVVGFPAVPILMSRARFCISAGHTRQDLDRALRELDEIADLLKLRYARSTFG
eukprot:CCRYP_020853-RC/>CCRYP_020853-RC protein AED:0.17 eAED:0.17 QI:0/0/0/1/0/0/4/0/599